MENMLQYDCEFLNLSTLKDQIRGKERAYIFDLLHNVDDKAEALAVLDLHFGDIRTVLPRLKMKLDKLMDFPDSEEGQVKNMQSLINYYKISKQHDLQDTAINFDFIQRYSCKLSRDQKKFLIDNKVETCAPFIAKLKDWQ